MVGKKIKGRKRHIVTDKLGNLLHIKVHAANQHDTIAGVQVFEEACTKYPSLKGVSVDAGYRGTTANHVEKVMNKIVEISEKITPEWIVLPTRWVVERTFAWFNGFRRLAKDYEVSVAAAENFVRLAHISILLPRVS